jgi:uncharacterized protein YjaG (DUF416 family)
METLRFNEQGLVDKLNGLSPAFRVLFAGIAAERLLPAYLSYSHLTGRGNPIALKSALDRLWRDLEGHPMDHGQVQETISLVMTLIPTEDNASSLPERAWAEDAAAAVAYALRCRENGQSIEAAWAARRAYEAVDNFVITKTGTGANEEVLSSPPVQAELSRQCRDLHELLTAGEEDVVNIARRMRQRALAESKIVFKENT